MDLYADGDRLLNQKDIAGLLHDEIPNVTPPKNDDLLKLPVKTQIRHYEDQSDTAINKPSNFRTGDWFSILILAQPLGYTGIMFAFSMSWGNVAISTYSAGNWSAWKPLATYDQIKDLQKQIDDLKNQNGGGN